MYFTKKQQTPLFVACINNNEKAVQLLLRQKADPNIGDKNEQTPLHICVVSRFTHLAEILLRDGRADPRIEDANKITPLQLVAKAEHSRLRSKVVAAADRIVLNTKKSPSKGLSRFLAYVAFSVTLYIIFDIQNHPWLMQGFESLTTLVFVPLFLLMLYASS